MQLQRRTMLLLLVALFLGGLATFAAHPTPALAGGPGPGWVAAEVVKGGCITIAPGQEVCNSDSTPGEDTLYEYVPARDRVSRGEPAGPAHGGDRTFEYRDYCDYPTPGLAAGTWHWGGHWVYSYNARTKQASWVGPMRTGWAFEHQDNCKTTSTPPQVAPPAATPTIAPTPPGNPPGPGNGPVPTPMLPPIPYPTPTVFIPTPPPSPCIKVTEETNPELLQKWPLWTPDGGSMASSAPGPMRLPTDRTFNFTLQGDISNFRDKNDPTGNMQWSNTEILLYDAAATLLARVPLDVSINTDGGGNMTRAVLAADTGRYINVASIAPRPTLWQLYPSPQQPQVSFTIGNNLAPGVYRAHALIANSSCVEINYEAADFYFQVGSPADLHVQKSGPTTAYLGGQLTYRIDYQNIGSGAGQGVVVRDTLPAGLTFVSASPAPSSQNGGDLAWNLGTLAPGESGSIFITADIDTTAGSVIANTARLTTTTPGGCASASNCSSTVTTDIGGPTLKIDKLGPDVTITNAAISYQLLYRNVAQASASNVVITDDLPAGLSFVSAIPAPSSQNGNSLSWDIGDLPAGGTGSIFVNAKVTAAGGSITNQTAITTTTRGGCTSAGAQCSSSKTSTVIAPPVVSGSLKLWLNSDLDPARGVHLTKAASVATPAWPAGEALNFAPQITVQPIRDVPGVYRVRQRIAAWSLDQINAAPTTGTTCKTRDEPTAADMDGVDATVGCLYKYHDTPSAAQMQRQAHVFWTQTDPRNLKLRADWYSAQMPDLKNASVKVTVLVVMELVDDNPTSATYGTVVYSTTSTTAGTFGFALLVPRSTS